MKKPFSLHETTGRLDIPGFGRDRRARPGLPAGTVLAFLMAVVLLMTLSGCSGASAEQQRVYDDTARIARVGDTYHFLSRVGSTTDTEMAITFRSFTGKQTVWTLETDAAATIGMDINALVEGGRFKVCLIRPDRTLATICEGTRKERIPLSLPAGKNELVLVGQDARGRLAITWGSQGSVRIRKSGGN